MKSATISRCGTCASATSLLDAPIRFFAITALLFFMGASARAQNVQHLNIPQPGGMPGNPVVTAVERSTNKVIVTWDGPPGYYQLYQKPLASGGRWTALGGRTNLARRATITATSSNAFFKVLGPAPKYVGGIACRECHQTIHTLQTNTPHAQAFAVLKQIGQEKNASCLPCHTVGYGLPTGYTNETVTPKLAGVQCESCHGPAANHAANPDDVTLRPRVELAGTLCGGCHTGHYEPQYEEWRASEHSSVVLDMNPTNRISSCGRCHSGSARLSLIERKALPTGDANVEIGCVVCHEPHQKTANPVQLRNPIASTNDYFLSTSDNFPTKYNTNISLCAQCHNHRGATWSDSSRPPHHSPQYNILLGTVGELASGLPPNEPAAHAVLIKNQCVACHMATNNTAFGSLATAANHSMKVQFDLCRDCHPNGERLKDLAKMAIDYNVSNVKAWLDFWAMTKAPAALWNKYGTRAWEYTTPGELSSGGTGPSASEQAQIPPNIQKARFNLYLVLHDGSFGVHNGPYAITLLETAQNWVEDEVAQ